MERLSTQKPQVPNQIEALRAVVSGFETGQVFLTALELDVFSHLREPRNAHDLAVLLGTRPDLTRDFLNVLTAMKLLTKRDGAYVNSPETAPFLIRDSPYFGRYLNPDDKSKNALLCLKQILQEGPAIDSDKHEHRFDRESMEWIARMSLLGRLQGTVRELTALPEFSSARKLIDLGGGHGLFGIAFAQENPDLQVVIFDKPEVIPITRDYIGRYGMGDRVHAMFGDYLTDDFGQDYDIVFEACSLGGSDPICRVFFGKVASALKNHGLFIRLTFTLDDDETGPLEPLLWKLKNHLSGSGNGGHRTHAELSHLLARSGFRLEKSVDMAPWCFNPMRLIVSRKDDRVLADLKIGNRCAEPFICPESN